MRVSIFGLGYVGCVSAGCLAFKGHSVIGVDVSKNKVELINSGRATIIEKDIDDIIREAHENGRLKATHDPEWAVLNSDISIVSVGTPSTKEGHLNLEYIFKVAEEIGEALVKKEEFHIVVIRSTVLPGTNEKFGRIIEEISGKKRNRAFAVVSNPEFLREGTAVHDYFNPPITVLGSDSERAIEAMERLYDNIASEFVVTDIRVAEIMKYVNNTFHALKIVFANEVGNICKSQGIDSHKVMEIFCKDTQLNISPYYFKPGFAYGGSCLPKDTKALTTLARDNYVNAPVIEKIHESNEHQKEMLVDMVVEKGLRNVAVLGLSFKPGTDDLRNSPMVDVVERLLGKGFNIKIYDKNVKLSEITGTNKDYIQNKIPHLQHFISNDINSVLEGSEIIILGHKSHEFNEIPQKYPGKTIIDLVREWSELEYKGHYEGISWSNINSLEAKNTSEAR